MARVFVSYRRADGLYAVGWLAERLRSLDSISGVQTAFHDAALRAGDDFPNALEHEIADADLVLAVIGPEWLGVRHGDMARITDEDDWVVREIATAFDQDTRVLPILMAGAEHPLASQIHPKIAALARLHAIPFVDGRDLDVVLDHVESHLSEIDRERAQRAGLEEPIEVPKLARPWLLAGLATLAATAVGLIGWLASWYRICPGGESSCAFTEQPASAWLEVLLTTLGIVLGAAVVVGTVLVSRLARVARLDWAKLLAPSFVMLATIVLAISGIVGGFSSPDPPINNPSRNWILFGVGVVMVVPWPLLMNIPRASEPLAPRDHLAERIRYLGTVADAERWATLILSVVVTLCIGVGAAMTHTTELLSDRDTYQPLLLVTFAVIFTGALIGSHAWNLSRLREYRALIDHDLDSLPPKYRRNAEPQLIMTWLNEGSWAFRTVQLLPSAMAVIIVVAVATGTVALDGQLLPQ